MFYQDQPDDEAAPSRQRFTSVPDFGVCPVCESRFNREGNSHLPFCSSRCRQIDLGRWLNESYGLPYEGDDRPSADANDFYADENGSQPQ